MRDKDGTYYPVRVGLHIHVYVWLSLIVISVLPFFVGVWLTLDAGPLESLVAGLSLIVAVQVLFWIARRECTDEALTFREGLLIVAASMAIGVGWISVLLTLPALAATVTIASAYSLAGLIRRSPEFAPDRYKRLVAWFQRHRMYQ